jgi:hypothetical protein
VFASYLLSGVVSASGVHKGPSDNLRGQLEHHGYWPHRLAPRRIGSGSHGRADSEAAGVQKKPVQAPPRRMIA